MVPVILPKLLPKFLPYDYKNELETAAFEKGELELVTPLRMSEK